MPGFASVTARQLNGVGRAAPALHQPGVLAIEPTTARQRTPARGGVMSTPDEDREVEGLKIYSYVSRLAESGATPGEIRQKLIEKGIDPKQATRLTDRLAATQAKKTIRARVTGLLAQGVAPDLI